VVKLGKAAMKWLLSVAAAATIYGVLNHTVRVSAEPQQIDRSSALDQPAAKATNAASRSAL
jgi:hypothetical protein